jgi:uncharacterized protein YmfQ (DUF2313 family)
MSAQASDYSDVMHRLRPEGPAMAPLDPVLDGLAEEAARVHNYLNDRLVEADPRTTFDLLSRWEQSIGLPDACCGVGADYQSRINALVNKVIGAGDPTPQYFIDLAARAGYTITITTFSPYTVGSLITSPIYPANIVYVWQVNAPLNSVSYFTVIDAVDSYLAAWGNSILECIMNRAKQAHTFVQFSYS